MSANTLFISVEILKSRTAVHGNLDPQLINSDIKLAQDQYIEPAIGTALFNKLIEMINDGSISNPTNEKYKELLDKHIIDCMIWYTLVSLPTTISYQFWNKGTVRKQGQDTELPTMTELVDLSNMFKSRAEFYRDRMVKYLKRYAPTNFPEYLNPGNGIDDIHPDRKSFTLPVYLGDDDCCCDQSYEQRYQGNNPKCCD